MTTQTLSLSEFLLARIAEDETVAMSAREHEYLSAARDASMVNSGRMLAECRAKRAIVAMSNRDTQDELMALAAVYADHPDYRSEWAA